VADLAGTVAEPEVYAQRRRVCEAGYLRVPYSKPDGEVGYRCPAEPAAAYVRKGGKLEETAERRCVCNGLIAAIGLGQRYRDGASGTASRDYRAGSLVPARASRRRPR